MFCCWRGGAVAELLLCAHRLVIFSSSFFFMFCLLKGVLSPSGQAEPTSSGGTPRSVWAVVAFFFVCFSDKHAAAAHTYGTSGDLQQGWHTQYSYRVARAIYMYPDISFIAVLGELKNPLFFSAVLLLCRRGSVTSHRYGLNLTRLFWPPSFDVDCRYICLCIYNALDLFLPARRLRLRFCFFL